MFVIKDLMESAYRMAQSSPDPRTQNAAQLYNDSGNLILSAVNTFPKGISQTDSRWADREEKLKYVIHAEANVLHVAARFGIATKGLILVSPWAACIECAKVIIQCGIKRVITQIREHPFWDHNIAEAHAMLCEAGVRVVINEDKFPHILLRRNGQCS